MIYIHDMYRLKGIVELICPVCNKVFVKEVRNIRTATVYCSNKCSASATKNRAISDKIKFQIKELHLLGYSSYLIADKLSVSRNTVMKYW